MAKHEVVFQDFAELAARLGLDAEELTSVSADTETAPPPVLLQPESSCQVVVPAQVTEVLAPVVPMLEPARMSEPTETALAAPQLELTQLLAELAAAGTALAAAARQDEAARTAALEELQRYDGLMAASTDAEQASKRARGVCRDAEALRERAFGDAARSEAARILDLARRAEGCAAAVFERDRGEAQRLAGLPLVRRLLEEREAQAAAERARAEAAGRAARRAAALGSAQQALRAGRLDEALAFVERAASDCTGEDGEQAAGEVAALRRTVDLQVVSSKITAVEAAVREARGALPDRPADAVARLEGLDGLGLGGLPLPLLAQRFGVWAQACARWCAQRGLHAPLRYAPVPGRGAVFARETPDGPYVLVSAIGTPERWRAGDVVGGRSLRDARPLCVR